MKYEIICIVFALIFGFFIGWSAKPVSHTRTEGRVDTVTVERMIIDTVKSTELKYIKTVVPGKVNIDSLWRDALAYWESINPKPINDTASYLYTTKLDTVYQDGLLTAKIGFNSLLPLHPDSYFDFSFRVREKVITKEIILEKSKTFWDGFKIGIMTGYGVSMRDMSTHPFIGLGVTYGY